MRAEVVLAVGKALYGGRWKSALAVDLGVTYRTLHRWISDDAFPDDFVRRLKPVVTRRIAGALEARKLLYERPASRVDSDS